MRGHPHTVKPMPLSMWSKSDVEWRLANMWVSGRNGARYHALPAWEYYCYRATGFAHVCHAGGMTMDEQRYWGRWTGYDDMKMDWQGPRYDNKPEIKGFPTADEVIFASYGGGGYDGYGFVLWERDGKLYENHGSHCSCNGLDDQWSPSETTWKALAMWKPDPYEVEQDAIDALKRLVESHL